MAKYYVLLFLAFAFVLLYVFLQDPCGSQLRADFSDRYPDYEILSSGAGINSEESVQCHVRYQKPGTAQAYEDVWLFENRGDGWIFSQILESAPSNDDPV
jgi:hypothetical protein